MKERNLDEILITPETVMAMCHGDEEAYQLIYYRYRQSLLAFLVHLTGSREESEDILQTTFIQLWENRERVDPEKNIKSYIFTISKNAALKYLQKDRRYDALPPLFDAFAEGGTEADSGMIAKETSLLIEIAVRNMPKNRQEVFRLYQEGFTYDQIAAKLDITQQNVRKYIMRARNDIKELLGLIAFFLSVSGDGVFGG